MNNLTRLFLLQIWIVFSSWIALLFLYHVASWKILFLKWQDTFFPNFFILVSVAVKQYFNITFMVEGGRRSGNKHPTTSTYPFSSNCVHPMNTMGYDEWMHLFTNQTGSGKSCHVVCIIWILSHNQWQTFNQVRFATSFSFKITAIDYILRLPEYPPNK